MENPEIEKKPRRYGWVVITILGLLILVGIASLSAFGGYRSGINMRKAAESTQIVQAVKEQYTLGLQDMQQGQYDRSRQRFEYVIRLDPDYPGATEKLAEVLLELNTTATPTLGTTPTLTPTPDDRGIEEIFNQAQQQTANNDWSGAIETLLRLRKEQPDFKPIEVDGLLFIALRNRGVDKILKEADLEGGLYDLALAERFGPLDTEAQSFKTFAGLYITGASFWGLDYVQAAQYFSQVAPHMPNLRDGSGLTAAERYRQALIEQGYQMIREGRCSPASEQFRTVLSIYNDPGLEAEFSAAVNECEELRSKPNQNP
jgi:tetratricopeptide (TPR) repeat protein